MDLLEFKIIYHLTQIPPEFVDKLVVADSNSAYRSSDWSGEEGEPRKFFGKRWEGDLEAPAIIEDDPNLGFAYLSELFFGREGYELFRLVNLEGEFNPDLNAAGFTFYHKRRQGELALYDAATLPENTVPLSIRLPTETELTEVLNLIERKSAYINGNCRELRKPDGGAAVVRRQLDAFKLQA